MNVLTFDAVTPLRDWLRLQASPVGARWYAGKLRPDTPESPLTYPAGRIQRVGGGDESPCLDRPLIQLDIFGKSNTVGGEAVAEAAAIVVNLLRSTVERTVLRAAAGGEPNLLFMGATVLSNLDLPDDIGPRRSLTVDLTTLAVP